MGNACMSRYTPYTSVVVGGNVNHGKKERRKNDLLSSSGSSSDHLGASLREFPSTIRVQDSTTTNNSFLSNTSRTFDQSLPSLTENEAINYSRSGSQKFDIAPEFTEGEEFGSIQYTYDSIEDAANNSDKPIFCVTVVEGRRPGNKTDGQTTLSHPLLVEAAETLFETVAMKQPSDEDRQSHTRASWQTIVRILDADGSCDLTGQAGGDGLCIGTLASRMIEALETCNIKVPIYLQLLKDEEDIRTQTSSSTSGRFKILDRTALFCASDSNQAEVDFAGVSGVIGTQIGIYQSQIVVEVSYFGICFAQLLRRLVEEDGIANIQKVYCKTTDERVTAQIELGKLSAPPGVTKLIASDAITFTDTTESKLALRRTELRYVPMTPFQAMKANRLIHLGSFHKAVHLLSPRQGAILMKSYSNVSLRKDVAGIPILEAWQSYHKQGDAISI